MASTIWKFTVPIEDTFTLRLPTDSNCQILSVQAQDGEPRLWVRLDPDAPHVERTFHVAGTGHNTDRVACCRFVGTFQLYSGALVFHLFVEPR